MEDLEGFFSMSVPEELEEVFNDPITETLMRNAVFCFGRTYDLRTLETYNWRDPFNPSSAPVDPSTIQQNVGINSSIESYLNKAINRHLATLFAEFKESQPDENPPPNNSEFLGKLIQIILLIKDRPDRSAALNGSRQIVEFLKPRINQLLKELQSLSLEQRVTFLQFLTLHTGFPNDYLSLFDKHSFPSFLQIHSLENEILLRILSNEQNRELFRSVSEEQLLDLFQLKNLLTSPDPKTVRLGLIISLALSKPPLKMNPLKDLSEDLQISSVKKIIQFHEEDLDVDDLSILCEFISKTDSNLFPGDFDFGESSSSKLRVLLDTFQKLSDLETNNLRQQIIDLTSQKEKFSLGLKFFLHVLTHSKKELILVYANDLEKIMQSHIPSCAWVLQMLLEENRLKQFLLESTLIETREAVSRLISIAVDKLLPFGEIENPSVSVLESLVGMMPTLPVYWGTFSQYFGVLLNFAKRSYPLRQLLVRYDVPVKIFNLMLNGIVSTDGSQKIPKMGDRFESPNFGNALSIIALLVRNCTVETICENEVSIEENPFAFRPDEPVQLHPRLVSYLKSEELLRKLIPDKNLSSALTDLFTFWVWEDEERTQLILRLLKNSVNDAEFDTLPIPFEILTHVLFVEDSFQVARVNTTLNNLAAIYDKFRKYPKYSKQLCDQVFELFAKCEPCKKWHQDNPNMFSRVPKMLGASQMSRVAPYNVNRPFRSRREQSPKPGLPYTQYYH